MSVYDLCMYMCNVCLHIQMKILSGAYYTRKELSSENIIFTQYYFFLAGYWKAFNLQLLTDCYFYHGVYKERFIFQQSYKELTDNVASFK